MKFAPIAALLFFAAALPAVAADNYYVVTSVTQNCSPTSALAGGFPVYSFSVGGADTSTASGTTVNTSKVALGGFALMKNFDSCSAALVTQFLEARTIPTVQFVDIPAAGHTASLTITLTNAIINSYALSGASGTGPGTESLQFSFQKMCVNSNPTDGTKPTSVCYDALYNRVS